MGDLTYLLTDHGKWSYLSVHTIHNGLPYMFGLNVGDFTDSLSQQNEESNGKTGHFKSWTWQNSGDEHFLCWGRVTYSMSTK